MFKDQPPREKLWEKNATLCAQWSQPDEDISYSRVTTLLNKIAQGVLNCFKEKYPNHSIFSTPAETFSYWENNNIDENHWNEDEGTQIMDTLMEYIFGKLNFLPNKLEDTKLEHASIDNVS